MQYEQAKTNYNNEINQLATLLH